MFNLVFLLAALSLVWGLRLQSNPESAKKGNFLASMGMGFAIIATLFIMCSIALVAINRDEIRKTQSVLELEESENSDLPKIPEPNK